MLRNLEEEWWVKYPENPNATMKLYVFPYSGCGPNTFSQWSRRLSEKVEVAVIYLPCRMGRAKQPPMHDWRELATEIGDAIVKDVRKKAGTQYAIYGHSFGALLAYMTVLRIRERGATLPVTLMVGAKAPPQSFKQPPPNERLIHDMSMDEMRALYMKNFAHAAPPGYLDMPGIVETILPPLQMDLGINQKFWWTQLSAAEQKPLACDVFAFWGEKDNRTKVEELQAWEEMTEGAFQLHYYSGNHFFIHEDQNCNAFLDDVMDALRPHMSAK